MELFRRCFDYQHFLDRRAPGLRAAVRYTASKFGVTGLTKSALDLARYGIRVNSVHPGVVLTPMPEHLPHSSQPGGET